MEEKLSHEVLNLKLELSKVRFAVDISIIETKMNDCKVSTVRFPNLWNNRLRCCHT